MQHGSHESISPASTTEKAGNERAPDARDDFELTRAEALQSLRLFGSLLASNNHATPLLLRWAMRLIDLLAEGSPAGGRRLQDYDRDEIAILVQEAARLGSAINATPRDDPERQRLATVAIALADTAARHLASAVPVEWPEPETPPCADLIDAAPETLCVQSLRSTQTEP
ncbi:MAG TPA: hypothetical protein PKC22_10615 [Rhodocyclaceae bacterium]|nr:hypothetical protein [Rhodocyclaceae bacterium]